MTTRTVVAAVTILSLAAWLATPHLVVRPEAAAVAVVLLPGADPSFFRLDYPAATRVEVDAAGELEVSIAGRRHHAARPRAYQVAGGRVIDLSAHYALDEGGRVRVLFDRVDPQLPITFVPFSPQAGVR